MTTATIMDLTYIALSMVEKLREAWVATGKSPDEFDTLCQAWGARLTATVAVDEKSETAALEGK